MIMGATHYVALSLLVGASSFCVVKHNKEPHSLERSFYFLNQMPKGDAPKKQEEEKPRMYAVMRRNPEEEFLEPISSGQPDYDNNQARANQFGTSPYSRRPHRLGLR